MMRLVALLCAAFALARAETSIVSQCPSTLGPFPIKTGIEGCKSSPCVLPQLEDAVVNITFRAPFAIQSMTTLTTIQINIGSISLPLNLQEKSGTCDHLTKGHCPVLPGEVIQYSFRLPIEPFFPAHTAGVVVLRVVDQERAPIFCVQFPIRIDPPRNSSANNLSVEPVKQVAI